MNENLRAQIDLLPEYLGAHLVLALSALGLGILISVPLGMIALRLPRLRSSILGVSIVILTIPSLALLALMVPLLGIGFAPAFTALMLYSTLPIIRNTVAGLEGVEPSVIEAARGIGFTPGQILFKVRLPLAMPIILAGIRTAAVWTVSIATLATPVGATSLGNYIFSGLTTQNYTALVFGCVVAALLAVTLDGLIHLIEVSVARNRPRLGIAAGIALACILAGGLAPVALKALQDRQPPLILGTKSFTEQYILTGVMAHYLHEAGYATETRRNMGSMVVFDATARGEIDAYVDYSGTVWSNHMKRDTNPGKEAITSQVAAWLQENRGIHTPGSLGFENRYDLAMRRDRAEALGIKTIDDLALHAGSLVIGGDYEIFSRPEWAKLRDAYGLTFREKRTFDPALMYQAVRNEQVDVITAFSTDGRIPAYDLVLLEDPRNGLLTYEALILLSPKASNDDTLLRAIQPMIRAIDVDAMQEANKLVDVDKRPVAVAVQFLIDRIDGNTDPSPEP